MIHILEEALLNAVLVTGLVVIMMMMIESINIESKGAFFSAMGKSRIGGVLVGALLGAVPGCLGGFATVSLYTHGMLSFGALVAMMIATAGDESFVMLATMPKDAVWIFALLFGIAIAVGLLTDVIFKKGNKMRCDRHFEIHAEDGCCGEHWHDGGSEADGHDHSTAEKACSRHFGWKRVLMFIGVALFIGALVTGHLEHEHGEEAEEAVEDAVAGFNLLSEEWMNVMFGILSLVVLVILVRASDHFVEEHLWHHIVVKHLPTIFAWTFGVLVLIGVLLHYFDISGWINDNTVLMILLATAIGIIPESGPHLIFVMLYAQGILPLPVLLASCISQDGHASLPLLAESKTGFLKAKAVNCVVALAVGFGAMLLM